MIFLAFGLAFPWPVRGLGALSKSQGEEISKVTRESGGTELSWRWDGAFLKGLTFEGGEGQKDAGPLGDHR